MTDSPPIVMVFAATDPTGGAGLQADIMTLASMGCHPVSVVTAITVQDTMGVDGVLPIDGEWVSDQARCILEDMPVAAFKIGVLGSLEAVAAVAEVVSDYPEIPLILDPVLASGRGDELASEDMLTVDGASCTTTHRPVRRTDSYTGPRSSGDSDRRSTTSSDRVDVTSSPRERQAAAHASSAGSPRRSTGTSVNAARCSRSWNRASRGSPISQPESETTKTRPFGDGRCARV